MNAGISVGSIFKAVTATLILAIAGCRSPDVSQHASSPNTVRSNAASLLYQLLDEEANVSKLLIIKRDREELRRVIKNISSRAEAAHKELTRMAKEDPTLELKRPDLPPGEKAVRESISKKRAGELLRASGTDFEFKLLLTQVEALGYAEHLAKIAALNEPDQRRARVFTSIETQMRGSLEEVIALLRTPHEKPSR